MAFVCQAVELPPPREFMLVLVLLVATDVPATPAEAAARAGSAAGGAALAWLFTMAPALWARRDEVERQAVAAAFTALARLLETAGSSSATGARHGAVMAVRQARTAVRQAGSGRTIHLVRRVAAAEALLEAALTVEVEAAEPLDPAWPAAVRALAGNAGSEPLPVQPRSSAATPWPGHRGGPRGARGRGRSGRCTVAAGAIRGGRSARSGAAAAVRRPALGGPLRHRRRRGVGIGLALGLGHAYWVGLTVAAVLQGSNLAVTRRRVLHRVGGTVVGVALAFGLLGWGPPVWVAVLPVAVAQFAIELVIATHYGLAVVPITVLSLVLFHLGAPGDDIGTALGARLLDTAIGVALALLLRRVLWPQATARRLPALQARVVSAVRSALEAAWTADAADVLRQQRRALQAELAAMRAVHADALADQGDDPRPTPAGPSRPRSRSWPSWRCRCHRTAARRLSTRPGPSSTTSTP